MSVSIAHVAVWTHDLERLAAFYARHFGANVGPRYTNPAKGYASRFLSFAQGARLELMQSERLHPVAHEPGAERMGLTHLALALGSEQRVDELTATLRAAGCTCVDGPRRTGDGYYESVVLDPDGNRLELTA
ncbi:MAG: VOC family protein [Gammaproteobacteria bacterium]|nr:VOC family protein [Gammaproteobacteria bacterium]